MFKRFVWLGACASLILGGIAARAQDAGALLDLLVRKRIITDQEAEEVRAELTKEEATTSAGKWKLSAPITELELYGDVRVRYDYRGGETAGNTPVARPGAGVAGLNDWQERSRERYRLRIGLRGTLAEDWFFGVRLETSTNPRSTNVTFGDDTSGNGPFAKNSDGINVGQAYAGYRGFRDVTLTLGRMPNPLITTWMTWDPDINPEGAAEQWKHTFTFDFGGGGAQTAQSYSKDGKAVATQAAASEGWKMKVDLFANFAQFIYDDSNPENPLGPRPTTTQPGSTSHQNVPNTDAWLMAWQVGARFTFPKTLYAQVAPTLYNYSGNGDTFNIHYQGGSPFLTNSASLAQNQTGINSLLVFDVPTEIGWKVGEIPMRLFGDFAVNLEGGQRALAAGRPDKDDQRYAWVIGAGIGQLKAKKDWQLDVFWQHSDQYALDPNLIDDDIFDAHLNMEGIGVRAGYMLTDAVFVSLTYNYGWRIDDTLGTGGSNTAIGINPVDRYQLFMADLNVKF